MLFATRRRRAECVTGQGDDVWAHVSAARAAHPCSSVACARLARGGADVRPVASRRTALRAGPRTPCFATRRVDGAQGRSAGRVGSFPPAPCLCRRAGGVEPGAVFVGGLFTRALQQASHPRMRASRHAVSRSRRSMRRSDARARRRGSSSRVTCVDRVRQLPDVASASMARMLAARQRSLGVRASHYPVRARPGGSVRRDRRQRQHRHAWLLRDDADPASRGPRLHRTGRAGAPLVAIVGEAAARRFWPGRIRSASGCRERRRSRAHRAGGRCRAGHRAIGALDFGAVPFVYLPTAATRRHRYDAGRAERRRPFGRRQVGARSPR